MVNKFGTIVFLAILTSHAVTTFASKQTSLQPPSQLATKNAEPIVLNVTVTDKNGGFVMGLPAENFEVSIDKKPAHVVSLTNTDSPVSVGILFDSSGSMGRLSGKTTAKNFAALREALRHFLKLSNQSNDYFLMGFNVKPQLLADWTSDPLTIIDKFNDLNVYGDTALYDACYLAVDKLHSGRHTKHALILISDGQDNLSHYTFRELRDLLRETDVVLYSIHFFNSTDGGSGLELEGSAILDEFSFVSGGKAFSDKDGNSLGLKDANPVFEIIATELRSQYTLSIVPTESMTSKQLHKIRVKVNLPPSAHSKVKGLEVRTRDGFYAH